MKMRPWLKKISRYVNTPVAVIASVSILAITTTSFLPIHLTTRHQERRISSQESSALNDDQYGKIIEVQDEYGSEPLISIPTESPSMTDIEPDNNITPTSPYQSIVGTIVSESLMHTNQKGHPVSMQVERQIQGDESMEDIAKIDVKEAALTVDMLRRDTGNTAYLSMPAPPEIPPSAELSVILTTRAQKLFADSQLVLSLQAWNGKMTIPRQTLQSENTDMDIHLRTDHQVVAPEGALGVPFQVRSSALNQQDVIIILPLPKQTFTSAQLKNLKVCAEYTDGSHEYLKGKIVEYNKTTKGIQFATHQSGNYTIVNMEKISTK